MSIQRARDFAEGHGAVGGGDAECAADDEPLACISYVPVQILSAVTGSAGIPLYIPLLDSSSNFEIIILRT